MNFGFNLSTLLLIAVPVVCALLGAFGVQWYADKKERPDVPPDTASGRVKLQ